MAGEPVIALSDVGVRFRVRRRGRRGKGIPMIFFRRRKPFWGIRELSLEVRRGELLGIIGPNGAGKSTLLRTMAGIYQADEGEARIEGRVAPMLSASAGLEPSLSGWENVELSCVLLGRTRAEAAGLATRVGEFAELGRFLDAPVRVYSSGMKARLGLAITLLCEPDILILDEVFSTADREMRERADAQIKDFLASGRTVVMASHEIGVISKAATRLIRLEGGTVVDDGPPGEVAKRYLADQDRAAHEQARPLRSWELPT
jgi:ABC-type polysaccharide/polyol phosphate transport system ATPase subunit